MEDLTLKWISENIEFLLVLAAGIYAIYRGVKKGVKDMLKPELDALGEKITNVGNKVGELETKVDEDNAALGAKIDELHMHNCKNFLIRYMSDVERGVAIHEAERERFSEEWDYYTAHDGNSYLKTWYNKLSAKGYL